MNKNIRSKVVRESLLDYNTLANSLKENTESAVKSLLSEAVRDTYAKLLSESDDELDYEEQEVDDTDSDITNDADSSEVPSDGEEVADAGMDADTEGSEEPTEGSDNADLDVDNAAEGGEDADNGDEWAKYDKYKISDDEYDFSNAEDEEIVKVYKLMKNDDQILVHKDDNGYMDIQDNETGAEYLINLGDNGDVQGVGASDDVITDDEGADDFGAEDDFENNDYDDMNESTERMFELVLEYDSNVGYTDNYQKKDVMTTPGMSEPGKNVNDWDAGVPKGKSKPWSSKKGDKSENQPFDGEKGKKVEESVDECGDGIEAPVEEGEINELKTNAEHAANNGSTSRTDGPNNPRRRTGRSFHTAQNGQETGTGDNAYKGSGNNANVDVEVKVENIMKRVNKTLKENKELKEKLTEVYDELKKAAVTNHNLAKIIMLVSENTTSQDEKKEIITRFKNEGKTIEDSQKLYESISRDLKKSNKMNITEDKSLTVESSKKINETPIYKSQDMLESLDLMHRMMK